MDTMTEVLGQQPEYSSAVGRLLPRIPEIASLLLTDIFIGTMNFNGVNDVNTFWKGFSFSYNELRSQVKRNWAEMPEVEKLLESLVRAKRGKSVGSANPPVFETIIENNDELSRWVK